MSELRQINLSEMFNTDLPSTEERLRQSYKDPVVRERFAVMMEAPLDELPGLQAQLNAYLAAGYALFPEESQVIHDSLERLRSYG